MYVADPGNIFATVLFLPAQYISINFGYADASGENREEEINKKMLCEKLDQALNILYRLSVSLGWLHIII